jgi:hypothetical protein
MHPIVHLTPLARRAGAAGMIQTATDVPAETAVYVADVLDAVSPQRSATRVAPSDGTAAATAASRGRDSLPLTAGRAIARSLTLPGSIGTATAGRTAACVPTLP